MPVRISFSPEALAFLANSCTNIFYTFAENQRNEKKNLAVTLITRLPQEGKQDEDLGLFGFWFKGCPAPQNEKGIW